MKKIYYLATCNTCKKIIAELGGLDDFEKHEIKSTPMTEADVDGMKALAGSYEAIFTKRSMKWRTLEEDYKANLGEDDYRKLILEEYTFLKRPVLIIGDQIFIGNAKKTVAAAKELIQ